MLLKNLIDVASGRKKAALVLKNCQVVNVFTQEILKGDIAIEQGFIAAIGNYDGETCIDMQNKYVCPGFIDSHVHIESSMVIPSQFAKAIVPRGTTTIIADPHEIANVCGIEGINFILEDSKDLPLDVYIMLPSCVPATPFEDSGAVLDAEHLKTLIQNERVKGIGEFMNYPGVINAASDVMEKLEIANGKIIDGHAPRISGQDLAAYVASGIKTDHECTTAEEMLEKLRLGMYIQIREGTTTKDVKQLVRVITPQNLRRCLFCTDDRHAEDILEHGHIDNNIRVAIKSGLEPIAAITVATLNVAECYGLKDRGAIASGYKADLVVIDDLQQFNVLEVYKNGVKVCDESFNVSAQQQNIRNSVLNTVNFKQLSLESLKLKISSNDAKDKALVIGEIKPGSLITQGVMRQVKTNNGFFEYDKDSDVCKIVVVERHKATGKIGLGLIEGFGIKNGAIASTIAHDSHNIIAVSDNDNDLLLAINTLKGDGGIVIVGNGVVLGHLPLPIAGLLCAKSIEEVSQITENMLKTAYSLGVNKNISPFMFLSFMALPVIPSLKITCRGLFNVEKFEFESI